MRCTNVLLDSYQDNILVAWNESILLFKFITKTNFFFFLINIKGDVTCKPQETQPNKKGSTNVQHGKRNETQTDMQNTNKN